MISGIGGLGHMAVQYAKAMGLNVAAVDVADDKLALAGARRDVIVNARTTAIRPRQSRRKPAAPRRARDRGVAPRPSSRRSAWSAAAARSSLIGLPPGRLPATDLRHGAERHHRARLDCRHAAQTSRSRSNLPGRQGHATYTRDRLDAINDIFDRMKAGTIDGRVVMKIAA